MIRKIVLIFPLFPYTPDSLDLSFYNVYLPLKQMGYEVSLFDPRTSNQSFEEFISITGTPDLVFSILTGEGEEPLEYISTLTNKGITTFNLFGDDSWRFDNWSSKICRNFTACGTTEPRVISKYQQMGYNNISLVPWFINKDVYCNHILDKKYNIVTSTRHMTHQRNSYKNWLLNDNPVTNRFGYNVPFETMILWMNQSKITLNLSIDSGGTTQTKARMFEAVACNSLLMTEYNEGIEEFWNIDKEIIIFNSQAEFEAKARWILAHDTQRTAIVARALARFEREYEAKIVLSRLLKYLEKL